MKPAPLKITVLGSGTSMGVPTLGCHCAVCRSTDPHDKRLRPSLLLSRHGQHVVIDTTPDFRQQAMRAGVDRLDAILFTHSHADHIFGFDDIRPFNIRQKSALPVYGNEETFRILRRAFAYVFDGKPTLSTVPSVTLNIVIGSFQLLGVSFLPIRLKHGSMEVLGFRFGAAAYLTDFSELSDASLALLEDLDVLIIDALRDIPHPMHQTVEQALSVIERLKPRTAWFTHIAHDLPHEATNQRLRKMGFPNVQLAYDGLQLEVPVETKIRYPSPPEMETNSHNLLAKQNSHKLATFNSAIHWKQKFGDSGRGSVLAIGNFDGIHLGHQAILRFAIERAEDTRAVPTALTFDPPPLKVLRPESAPPRLSTITQRLDWFTMAGLEAAVVLPFTMELAQLSPHEFVERILVRDLHVRAILVGENFHFGHQQSGNVALLRELGTQYNFEVVIIPPVSYHGEIVSSTIIRREITVGDVSHAGRLLGRAFVLSGPVISGTGTGARFTFPTLNLQPEQELLPARGVYITRTSFDGHESSHPSVTNVGMRPTFNGSSLTVETHILDTDIASAPKHIEVQFWKRLREEKKFSGPEELRAQIGRDIASAQKFFARLRNYHSLRQPV